MILRVMSIISSSSLFVRLRSFFLKRILGCKLLSAIDLHMGSPVKSSHKTASGQNPLRKGLTGLELQAPVQMRTDVQAEIKVNAIVRRVAEIIGKIPQVFLPLKF